MKRQFDYIIVGGGTAGCVLANRLTENPDVQVLLLEAGSRDNNPMIHISGGVGMLFGKRVNWRFRTVPQEHLDNREIWYPQGRTLGGSSAINAMIYIRAQREDYDGWEAAGNKAGATTTSCRTSRSPRTTAVSLTNTTAKVAPRQSLTR